MYIFSYLFQYFLISYLICFSDGKTILEDRLFTDESDEQFCRQLNSDSLILDGSKKERFIVFLNAHVFDGTGRPGRTNQTLIIENEIIKDIAGPDEIKIPNEALLLDLKGKTLIPGLIGMHNHLHIPRFPDVGDIAAKLYLASGVTTIQTCGAASPIEEIKLSNEIEAGKKIGPEIITSAPFITGKGGNSNMIIPKNEDHLRDTIRYWKQQGVNWFKVYRNITPEHLKVVIDEVHKDGGKVRGHLCSVTFEEASQFGIDGIEHGLNSISDFRTDKQYGLCDGGREYMDELYINNRKVRELQQLMIKKGVMLTSTLSIYEASIPQRAFIDQRTFEVMSSFLREQYKERRNNFDAEMEDHTREKRLKRIMQFEYQFFKMGGLLCSGVDAGRHVLPGFGDQRNFELLIEAGFTTSEAIQIMTSNGAKALQRNDIGTIEIGKRADFVILDGNLEANPSVMKNVEAVFKKGIGYDPKLILAKTSGQFGKN